MQMNTRAPWGFTGVVFIWGALSGVALVAMLRFASPDARPELTYGIFATLVLGSSITLRHAGGTARRFALGLATFMVATLVVYAYTIVVVNPVAMILPMWEHVWRLGFMLGIGALATSVPLAIGAGTALFRGGPRGPQGSDTQPRVSERSTKRKAPSVRLEAAAAVYSPSRVVADRAAQRAG